MILVKKRKNIILRQIHGSYFLIDITDNYSGDFCNLYEINETGKYIWENITDLSSINELVAHLKEVIIDEVPDSVIQEDTVSFLHELHSIGFVLIVE